jgi:hypothetical protein
MIGKQNINWKALTLSFLQLLISGILCGNTSLSSGQILAQNNDSIDNLNKCSHDLESLGNLLVKDIPSYTNRVMQKSRKLSSLSIPVYVIVASKPEFEPLPLSQTQYQGSPNETVKQVFFTTLERQYLQKDKVVETQNYHWLLLTETVEGWRMVMIFSRLGISNQNRLPSPPKDTSNGIMGQAVKLWLRDCRAGVK